MDEAYAPLGGVLTNAISAYEEREIKKAQRLYALDQKNDESFSFLRNVFARAAPKKVGGEKARVIPASFFHDCSRARSFGNNLCR